MRRRTRAVRLSSKGQVVIPADLRRQLGLTAGAILRIRATSAREVVLSAGEEELDIEAARRDLEKWSIRTGRDLVEELHAARRRARAEEAARREAWGR
ncbi:MAG: AbrB/MazE/SpoVT family DNA-binding domain-containing protein [Myxococcales bacterium]|nr:AbrB/MazE/SpoVT family DNA-binding domain-containing protein [Myxococcales bacterium]